MFRAGDLWPKAPSSEIFFFPLRFTCVHVIYVYTAATVLLFVGTCTAMDPVYYLNCKPSSLFTKVSNRAARVVASAMPSLPTLL